MSNNQEFSGHANPTRNSAAAHFQTVNPYMALVATAGPEHDGSSSSGSPPSSGSSVSVLTNNMGVVSPATPLRSQAQTYSHTRMSQQHTYGSPEQASLHGFSNNTPARAAKHGVHRTASRASTISAAHNPIAAGNYQRTQVSSLVGVPESVAVQEMAFRHGQRESNNAFGDVSASPFAKQFDQLWTAFYKLGKECGGQRAPTPVYPSVHNFAWPVLINPHTQSLEHPNGRLDPVWTRKMIQVALNCMQELIRVTCRRNTGWDKTVADIPLPAQEALVAFPDLAQQYEALKRDAKEARSGGRPYGY